jgi:multimeric flavodoxin WrbA
MKPKILGIAASLRNARWGIGNQNLIDELLNCASEEQLKEYLQQQAQIHLDNFINSGRAEGLNFLEISKNLQKLKGNCGLSNSEVALASALWSASKQGCDIQHLSLSEYFPASQKSRHLEQLKTYLQEADGILISTPVYFGDRSSLVQTLIDFINNDAELKINLTNKVYGGIAVGAKRNGGQETTLIYQLLDLINMGLLGVGNDSDTTSQYGGTGHAGDVGTMTQDNYGLWTAMGTGRRVAHVTSLIKLGQETVLSGKVRIMFWILQDQAQQALSYVQQLTKEFASEIETTIIDITNKEISRCLACDICPTEIYLDEKYRCIIKPSYRDELGNIHQDLLNYDAIIPVVYSPQNRAGLMSNYQQFIERTRYLRRGDYVFGDTLTAPLVIEDIGVGDNMSIRMMTSLLRHHTVLTELMNLYLYDKKPLNHSQIQEQFSRFILRAKQLTIGRLLSFVNAQDLSISKYNPVGYILSAAKDKEDEKLKSRSLMIQERYSRLASDAKNRLVIESNNKIIS